MFSLFGCYKCTRPCEVAGTCRGSWLRLMVFIVHTKLEGTDLFRREGYWWRPFCDGGIQNSFGKHFVNFDSGRIACCWPGAVWRGMNGEDIISCQEEAVLETLLCPKRPSQIVSNSSSMWMNTSWFEKYVLRKMHIVSPESCWSRLRLSSCTSWWSLIC